MFRAILYVQWKWTRLLVLTATIATFALPLLSLQGLPLVQEGQLTPVEFLDLHAAFGWSYPLAATFLALLLALRTWSADQAGRHVYALSLPLPRWHFVLLRLGAGLTLLAIPVAAVWLSALISATSVTLPTGLRAYPSLLALRFSLAALFLFGLFFAITAATARSARWILGALAVWLGAQLLLIAAGSGVDLINPVINALVSWPGPFDVFTGRWVLIDV